MNSFNEIFRSVNYMNDADSVSRNIFKGPKAADTNLCNLAAGATASWVMTNIGNAISKNVIRTGGRGGAILTGIGIIGGIVSGIVTSIYSRDICKDKDGTFITGPDVSDIDNKDNIDADDATKGKYEGSLDSAEQSYKDYITPKNTGGSNSPGDDPTPSNKNVGKMAGVMGYPIVLDLDGAVSPSGVASHEPLPIISGAALGGGEVAIPSLSLSRVASSSPTQTILRVA